jgi:serine/threonine-protein kinase SMG1
MLHGASQVVCAWWVQVEPQAARVLQELATLAAAAASIAAAIQSEHTIDSNEAPGVGAGSRVTPDDTLSGVQSAGAASSVQPPGVPPYQPPWQLRSESMASSAPTPDDRQRAYATAMLKKCIAKLEGKEGSGEGDKRRPLKVVQQVQALVRQASSLDNMCQMYEGWTAWI